MENCKSRRHLYSMTNVCNILLSKISVMYSDLLRISEKFAIEKCFFFLFSAVKDFDVKQDL